VVGDHIYYSLKYIGQEIYLTGKSTTGFTDFEYVQRTSPTPQAPGSVPSVPNMYISGGYVYMGYVMDNQVHTARNRLDQSGWESVQQTDSTGRKWRTYPQADGDRVYYVYMEENSCGWQIFTAESNADLSQWHASQRTSFCTTSPGEVPVVTGGHVRFQVAGGRIYYVWSYPDENGYWQVWTAEMNKDGTGWEARQRTYTHIDKWRPELHVVGGKVYMVWWEGQSHWAGGTIYTAVMGSNIVAKGGGFGIGLDEDLGLSGFLNNDHKYDLFLSSADASPGESVFGFIQAGWNHVALTYDGASMKLYVNGELIGGKVYREEIEDNPFGLLIGDNFKGLIDEVRISSKALSAAEITDRYQHP
jgi:hypothetical protein